MPTSVQVEIHGWNEMEEAMNSPRVSVHKLLTTTKEMSRAQEFAKRHGLRPHQVMVDDDSRKHHSKKNHRKDKEGMRQRSTRLLVELGVHRSLEEFWTGKEKKTGFALALDQIKDPQNFGALMRSAHFFGAEFLLYPKDHSSPITSTVVRASAGAVFSLPLIEVSNLSRSMDEFREYGGYLLGLDGESNDIFAADRYAADLVLLVLGSEGQGMRHLTQKKCDFLFKLTSFAGRDSLNVSVAGALAMYQIAMSKKQG
ncbi:MAG: RNA methyltransferase [Bdellovibrionota bacterium]